MFHYIQNVCFSTSIFPLQISDFYHKKRISQMEKQQQQQGYKEPKYVASVKVSDPIADAVKGFYTYQISGNDDLGTFDIRRRYNDFFYFREALIKKWPGVYVPPIPEKKIAGNKDVQNIEIRKKYFDYFMKRIGKIKHLFTCPITREFLRNKSVDMQKFYTTLQTPKYEDLIATYKGIYGNIAQKGDNIGQIKNNIQNFSSFLKKAQKELEGLRNQVQLIVEARAGFMQNLNACNTNMLPQYQKNVYSQYLPQQEKKDPNLIFVNDLKVQNNIRFLKQASEVNSFAVLQDHISYEILEVRAMEQAIKIKQKYEADKKDKDNLLLDRQAELAKLNSGKTTFKSLFSRGSKNQQIQKFQTEVPQLQKQIQSLQKFNSLSTVTMGLYELPLFKKNKQIQYYRMMYEVSQTQIKYLASYGDLMKSVMQGLNK